MENSRKLLTNHYFKIIKIIKSCENYSHIESCYVIIQNFGKYWVNYFEPKQIKLYILQFKFLLKRKSFKTTKS